MYRSNRLWLREDGGKVSTTAPIDFVKWITEGKNSTRRAEMARIAPCGKGSITITFTQSYDRGDALSTVYAISIVTLDNDGRLLQVTQQSTEDSMDWLALGTLKGWLKGAGYILAERICRTAGTATTSWCPINTKIWMVSTISIQWRENSTEFFAGPGGEEVARQAYLKRIATPNSGSQTAILSAVESGMLGDDAHIQWIA